MHGLHLFWYIVFYCAIQQNEVYADVLSCEELKAPLHGTVIQTADTAWFNCSDGYTLQGSKVIYCNSSNHMWSGETNPNCSIDNTRNSSNAKTRKSFEYLGCYNDVNIYKLKIFPDIGKYDPTLTLEKCWEICSNVRTAYFGVEQSNMCYCGKKNRNYEIHGPSTMCKIPCAGNSSQICGGQFTIDVYKIVYPSCEVLEAPVHGTVYQTTESAWFSCFDEYVLQGSKVVHCNISNYEWDGETNPICSRREIDITTANKIAATTSENQNPSNKINTFTENTVTQIPSWLLVAFILPSSFMVIVLFGGILLLSKYISLKYSREDEQITEDAENHVNSQYSPGYLTPAASIREERVPSEVFYRVSENEQPYEVLQTYHNCSVNLEDLRATRGFHSTFTGKPCLGNGVISHFTTPRSLNE